MSFSDPSINRTGNYQHAADSPTNSPQEPSKHSRLRLAVKRAIRIRSIYGLGRRIGDRSRLLQTTRSDAGDFTDIVGTARLMFGAYQGTSSYALHGAMDDVRVYNEVLSAADITNQYVGIDGADTIRGGTEDDAIFGDDGDDILWGDAGNDTISGGLGCDTIDGNSEC